MQNQNLAREVNSMQARNAALLYLCSMEAKYHSGLTLDGTLVRELALKDRTMGNDPLIKFYRERKPKDRIKNGVHLYLSLHGASLPGSEYIDRDRNNLRVLEDFSAYCLEPHFQKLRKDLFRTLDVNAGYFHLLVDIFNRNGFSDNGREVPVEMLKPLFDNNLFKEYQMNKDFDINEVIYGTELDLSRRISLGLTTLTPLKREVIQEQLEILTDKERKVIIERYRLDLDDIRGRATYEEIANKFNLKTRERVRLILNGATRKLRSKKSNDALLPLLIYPKNEQLQAHYDVIPKA